MDTLYDLLGALPRDEAEALRVAFRKAVKGSHPDLRPGDPEAAIKFRQIIRANEILLDKDQRAVYDHLLVLAKHEKDPASAHPIAARIHKIASTVLALTSLSLVTAGGYFLFMHMSLAWVAPTPAGSVAVASYAPASTFDLRTRLSASIAAVSPADAPDPAAVSAFIAAKADGTAATTSNAMAMATADAESATPGAVPDIDHASVSRPQDIAALIASEVNDPNHVARLDQNFTAPYVDRGLLFIRDRKDDHAFPELPLLRHAEKGGHPKSPLANDPKSLAAAEKGQPTDMLPKTVPLPVPRTVPLPVPRTVPRVVQPRPPRRPVFYTAGTFP